MHYLKRKHNNSILILYPPPLDLIISGEIATIKRSSHIWAFLNAPNKWWHHPHAFWVHQLFFSRRGGLQMTHALLISHFLDLPMLPKLPCFHFGRLLICSEMRNKTWCSISFFRAILADRGLLVFDTLSGFLENYHGECWWSGLWLRFFSCEICFMCNWHLSNSV